MDNPICEIFVPASVTIDGESELSLSRLTVHWAGRILDDRPNNVHLIVGGVCVSVGVDELIRLGRLLAAFKEEGF